MHRLHFIRYLVDGHLSCFHFSAVTNSPSRNILIGPYMCFLFGDAWKWSFWVILYLTRPFF